MKNRIMDIVVYKRNFLTGADEWYRQLVEEIDWDESMVSRKTACFGEPYDYSEQSYNFQPMSKKMEEVCDLLVPVIGFKPNNCLLNYYVNGNSKIGFHGDTTKMLESDTGIAIISLGDTRLFQIRRAASPTECYNYILESGSLLYMPNSMQEKWQHGVPKVISDQGRISLTFRKMVPRNLLD